MITCSRRTMISVLSLVIQLAVINQAESERLIRIQLAKIVRPEKGELGQPITSYYAELGVGTPQKKFRMLVDINARESWLQQESLLGQMLYRLNYKNGYSKEDSTSVVKEEKEIHKICHKGTELSGKACRDLVELKYVTESLSPAEFYQRFLVISSASDDNFARYDLDGVLAMNPWPLGEKGSDMIIVSLARAKLISQLMVGLSLDKDDESTYGGELTFGGFNQNKFTGTLNFHPLISQHSWELNLGGVMLGSEVIACATGTCRALISTSSNDIYAPPRHIARILAYFGYTDNTFDSKQLHEVACSRVSDAPLITFDIDSSHYILEPTAYIREMTKGLLFKEKSCYVAILSNGAEDIWELGTNFLVDYYTVFDFDERRIAFAKPTKINSDIIN